MARAMLFDLDGTLCLMDAEAFTKDYVCDMGRIAFAEIPAGDFFPNVMKSTSFCIKNPSTDLSCYEVFIQDFSRRMHLDPALVNQRMLKYYHEQFPKFGSMVRQLPLAPEVIKAAKAKGWQLALASNVLMPQFSMVERVRWCGIDPQQFDFIPGVDTLHYAKPNPLFYQEIIGNMGIEDASSCLMAGNDPQEDMAAKDAGLMTFLIAEAPNPADLVKADYHGTLGELLDFINRS
jgi:FMN phosphatase YigB (HAD superfamily)